MIKGWFSRKKPVVSSPVEIKGSLHLCDDCDVFPEGTVIVYEGNCSRGCLLLKYKSACDGYNSRVKQEKETNQPLYPI